MNIDMFLELYTKGETDVAAHIKTGYVPYETKANVAKAIVETCYWHRVELPDGTKTTRFYVDSVGKYMLSQMSMIDLYTDIERNKENMLGDYNKLDSFGIFDTLSSDIDKEEIDEYYKVIQMTCDDAITNYYEPHAFISSQVERFGTLIGAVLGPVLENIDIDKITEVISEITNREG